MDRIRPRLLSGFVAVALVATSLATPSLVAARGHQSTPAPTQDVRTITMGGSAQPALGAFTPSTDAGAAAHEFLAQSGEGAQNPYAGTISMSTGQANGVSINSGKKAKSNPAFINGFEGLNHYQQRYTRGGNQFSVEPPDQGLCVGNGYVVEAVNDVFNVFNHSGDSVLPDNTTGNVVAGYSRDVNHAIDLNSFLGYTPAIDRTTGDYGAFVTDPSCLYDAQTNRFFLVTLTLDVIPSGEYAGYFTGDNWLDIAVSQTGDPTGAWNVYSLDVAGDGNIAAGEGPYLGDYPHIGADANGFYVTTNSYPWQYNTFAGAQIYAMSKWALAAGAASVSVAHIDTWGMVNAPSSAGDTQPGFTVWPAQSPNPGTGNTEYFLSSNAADEATHPTSGSGDYTSDQIIVWTLKGTNALNGKSPHLTLSTSIVQTEQYALPPHSTQPGSGSAPGTDSPLGYCINDTTTTTIAGTGCWQLLFNSEPANAVVSTIDANDTRMQQVTYANGNLWGALDTAVNPDGGGQQAGIAWFVINPSSSKVVNQGYLGAAGYDFSYPAIGVTSSGRGIVAFTAMGSSLNPSAAYASLDANAGAGDWNIVPGGEGAAPEDGFSNYSAFSNPPGSTPRPRWGDYGAAAVDGNSIWIASEYVASACSYTDWGGPYFDGGSGDNLLGTCGSQEPSGAWTGTRTALANWSTYISHFKP